MRLPLRSASLLERAHLLPLVAALERRPGVVVLAHHRIGSPLEAPGDAALYSATQEQFDEQLRAISSVAQLIAPDDLEDAWQTPGRHVLLTFDDGYADARHAALPVLEAHGARAAFFITTGLVDAPRLPWWDELAWLARRSGRPDRAADWIAHYKLLPSETAEAFVDELAGRLGLPRAAPECAAGEWCTWEDVRALQAAGMEIGAHTHDHPVLARASPSRQRAEVRTSLDRLEAETGRRPRWFAYPVGGRDCFDLDTRKALRKSGVRLAFSAYGGSNSAPPADRYDVRRLSASIVPARLRAQVRAPRTFVGAR